MKIGFTGSGFGMTPQQKDVITKLEILPPKSQKLITEIALAAMQTFIS